MKMIWSVLIGGLMFLWFPSFSVSQKVDKKLDPIAAKKAAKSFDLVQCPKELKLRAEGIEASDIIEGKFTSPVATSVVQLTGATIESNPQGFDTLNCRYKGANSLSFWIRQKTKKGACQVNQDKASFSCTPK